MTVDREPMEDVVAQYRAWRPKLLELRQHGEHEAALEAAKSAVELLQREAPGLAYVLEAGMDLATMHGVVADWVAAEAVYAECVRCRAAVLGPRDAATATAEMMLGVAKIELARYDEAEPLIERCLSVRRALFGPSHPQVGLALSNLAAVYDHTGRADQAQLLRDQAQRMGVDSLFPPQA
jgi:tetratricopeptide (TPR) repeat protein